MNLSVITYSVRSPFSWLLSYIHPPWLAVEIKLRTAFEAEITVLYTVQ